MRLIIIIFVVFFIVASNLYASGAFPLDNKDKIIIGAEKTYIIQDRETLIELARKYNVGYNEIVSANSGLDPWVPDKGSRIKIPTAWLLPEVLDEGILINLAEMRLYYFFTIESLALQTRLKIIGSVVKRF